MAQQVVDVHYAKSDQYRNMITKIAKVGKCPFCPKHFKHHRKKILQKEGAWFITENSWPYRETRWHLLIIGITHKERLSELTPGDMANILKLLQWAERRFKIPGGGFAMRFGQTRYTGATVCHLHAHLIVPKLNRKTGRAKVVSFPVG